MWKFLFAFLPCSAWALDLNPEPGVRELEGVTLPVVHFQDTKGKVRWSPPEAWRMVYDKGILQLTPKEDPKAAFQIRVIPRTAGDREVFTKTETLEPYCAGFLPDAPKVVKYESTQEGPFTIGPLSAREFLLKVGDGEAKQLASVSFVDLNERERLVVVVIAAEGSFTNIRDEAIRSMFSWQAE